MLALFVTAQVVLGASPAGQEPKFVLLRPGTVFEPPAGIEVTERSTKYPGCDDSQRTVVARFVGESEGRIEIETLGLEPDQSVHCGVVGFDDEWFPDKLSSFRIRVFVDPESVMEVTSRPVSVAFPDGTSAQFEAGLPVSRHEGDPAIFEVKIDEQSVGTTYSVRRPPRHAPPREGAVDGFSLVADVEATIGDRGKVTLRAGSRWPKAQVKVRGDHALITLVANCATVVGKVPANMLKKGSFEAPRHYGSTHLCGVVSKTRVKKGAKVFWPNGRIAGVVTQNARLGKLRDMPDGKRCTDVTLQGTLGSLPLCFRDRDVEHLDRY